jgi:hypothetical protein
VTVTPQAPDKGLVQITRLRLALKCHTVEVPQHRTERRPQTHIFAWSDAFMALLALETNHLVIQWPGPGLPTLNTGETQQRPSAANQAPEFEGFGQRG